MTDSTNAKLRELRERVAAIGERNQRWVRREDVLRLIDAMIQEAGE